MVEYEVTDGIVEVRAEGTTSGAEWLEAHRALREAVGEREVDALLDFSRHESVVPVEVIEKLAGRIRVQRSRRRWAFVVSRPVSVGMVNMIWRALSSANIETRTFEDAGAARAWLAEDRPSQPA